MTSTRGPEKAGGHRDPRGLRDMNEDASMLVIGWNLGGFEFLKATEVRRLE
jgi:hypothetical protein